MGELILPVEDVCDSALTDWGYGMPSGMNGHKGAQFASHPRRSGASFSCRLVTVSYLDNTLITTEHALHTTTVTVLSYNDYLLPVGASVGRVQTQAQTSRLIRRAKRPILAPETVGTARV